MIIIDAYGGEMGGSNMPSPSIRLKTKSKNSMATTDNNEHMAGKVNWFQKN